MSYFKPLRPKCTKFDFGSLGELTALPRTYSGRKVPTSKGRERGMKKGREGALQAPWLALRGPTSKGQKVR